MAILTTAETAGEPATTAIKLPVERLPGATTFFEMSSTFLIGW
jgi:hypothetical protein